jgi:hypothetical protein
MITERVLHKGEGHDPIEGRVFHIFYPDIHTSLFFDKNLSTPIIWGQKSIVMGWVKKLDELLNVPSTTRVRIYSYINDLQSGYRRVDTYNGPIETIGKYIIRI